MADKTIGELKRATSLDDDSLLIAEQQGEAVSLPGSLFKQFVEDAADEQVGAAKQYAENAKQSAEEAKTAVGGIGNAVEDTKNNAQAAEDARKAIEDMVVEAVTLATGTPASVTKELINGVVKLVFGLPSGDKGDKGDPGNSIQSITRTAGNGAPGTTDTYTVTLTDGSTTEFYVYNGKDGMGAGDMTASVYDPQGKATDIFAYVDDKVKDIDPDVTADEVTFSDGETFQQKYDKGELTGPRGLEGPQGTPGQQGKNGLNALINDAHRVNLVSGEGIEITEETPRVADGMTGETEAWLTISAVETDPTVPAWAKAASKPTYTASEVGAGTFAGQVVANGSGQAHSTSLLRNCKLVSADTNPTVNGEICWTYK